MFLSLNVKSNVFSSADFTCYNSHLNISDQTITSTYNNISYNYITSIVTWGSKNKGRSGFFHYVTINYINKLSNLDVPAFREPKLRPS